MALKCVTCGLLFRNRNELDWHIRQEHLQRRLPPTKDSRHRPRLRPRTEGERHVSATTIRPKHRHPRESPANGTWTTGHAEVGSRSRSWSLPGARHVMSSALQPPRSYR
jgi:uncharacterized C2H2 Zn-finger protein